MKIGLIMPTRLNKERLSLIKYAGRQHEKQTLQPDHIEIVDFKGGDRIDITKRYRVGFQRLASKVDLIFAWEDDDWYDVRYLEIMTTQWIKAGKPHLIGINQTLYYNIIANRFLNLEHADHSSMYCTGISSKAPIRWCSDNEVYLDMYLWKNYWGIAVGFDRYLSVGIKHGLGKCASNGHVYNWGRWVGNDNDLSLLKKLVDKESFEFYKGFSNNVLT